MRALKTNAHKKFSVGLVYREIKIELDNYVQGIMIQ